jgi:hypothetical protein
MMSGNFFRIFLHQLGIADRVFRSTLRSAVAAEDAIGSHVAGHGYEQEPGNADQHQSQKPISGPRWRWHANANTELPRLDAKLRIDGGSGARDEGE